MCLCVPFLWRSLRFLVRVFLSFSIVCVSPISKKSHFYSLFFCLYLVFCHVPLSVIIVFFIVSFSFLQYSCEQFHFCCLDSDFSFYLLLLISNVPFSRISVFFIFSDIPLNNSICCVDPAFYLFIRYYCYLFIHLPFSNLCILHFLSLLVITNIPLKNSVSVAWILLFIFLCVYWFLFPFIHFPFSLSLF